MTTFQFLWRVTMYRPIRYWLNALVWTLIYLAPIAPGLITKQFFNTLTDNSALHTGFGELSLC